MKKKKEEITDADIKIQIGRILYSYDEGYISLNGAIEDIEKIIKTVLTNRLDLDIVKSRIIEICEQLKASVKSDTIDCPVCEGKGWYREDSIPTKCVRCNGTGTVEISINQ